MKKKRKTKYAKLSMRDKLKLRSFVIGSMLGDGCIRQGKAAKNARLSFGHGLKQKKYLEWKVSFLKDLGLATGNITTVTARSDRYKKGYCVSYHMKSRSHPEFSKYRELFYVNNKKIIPELVWNIDPFALAIWFMDDGYLWKRKDRTPTYRLCTTSFSQSDIELLIDVLKKKFGITASRIYDNEIYIYVESCPKFRKLIEPHVLPDFKYKLGPE